MNVTLDKIDNVNAVLTISLEEQDYQAEVKKQLNELGRRRPLKGFRPGHVPMGLLQKAFGAEVLVDVVDHMVGRTLSSYIVDNKVDVLGEPMMNKDTKFDYKNEKEFTFKFDLGLAPEFELTVDKKVKVPYYVIQVSDKMVEDQNESFKKRFGKQVPGEESAMDSMLRGSMIELNADGTDNEDGIKVERTVISPQYLKNDEEKPKFVGCHVGDDVVFNPHKAANGSLVELAAMLNVDKAEDDVKSDFRFHVEEIMVNQDAEMNQELFDNVLGKDEAKTEEEYLAKVREMIAGQLKNDSNYRFTIDVEQVLKDTVGEMQLPDEFLKRYFVARDKEHDAEKVEKDYPQAQEQIKWQLIKERVARDLKVEITADDRMNVARFYAAQQFAQYGMRNLPEDVIDRYAKEMLDNEKTARDIDERAFEDKVFAAIKDAVTIQEKEGGVDEFNKLFEKK